MTRKRFKKLILAEYAKSYLQMLNEYPYFDFAIRNNYNFYCRLLRDAKFENLKIKTSYQDAYNDFIIHKYGEEKDDAEKM